MEIDNTHTHTHTRAHTHARTNNNITQKHVRVMTTCSKFSIEMILIHVKNGGLHVVYVK